MSAPADRAAALARFVDAISAADGLFGTTAAAAVQRLALARDSFDAVQVARSADVPERTARRAIGRCWQPALSAS